MQTAEMVARVSGAGGRVVKAQERLVFGRDHGVEVGQGLVAEFGPVHLGAESGKFVPAAAPARRKLVAGHGDIAMAGSKIEVGNVMDLVCEAGNPENLVQIC